MGATGSPTCSGNKDYDLTIVSATSKPNDIAIYAREPTTTSTTTPTRFKKIMADLNLDHRSGQAHRDQAGHPEAARQRLRRRLPVRAAQDPASGTQGRQGPVGKRPDPGQRPDRPSTGTSELTSIGAGAAAAAAAAQRPLTAAEWPSFSPAALASLLLSLIVASIVIFLVLEVLPGDPAQFMLGHERPARYARGAAPPARPRSPPLVRYFGWIGGMLHGDFGISYTYRVPVGELIAAAPLASVAAAGALSRWRSTVAHRLPGRHPRRRAAQPPHRPRRHGRRPSSASRCRISGSPCCWCWLFSVTLHWFSRRRLSRLGPGLLAGPARR